MIKRIYLSILVLLFAASGIFAQAPSVKIGEDDAVYGPGVHRIPVYLQNFTSVDGFQLDFTFDEDVITWLGIPEDSRFATGLWTANPDNSSMSFLFFPLGAQNINGKVFELEIRYEGGVDTEIGLNATNSFVISNGTESNLEGTAIEPALIVPDPDLTLGTLTLGSEPEAVIGSEVIIPVSIGGEGFAGVSGMELRLLFDDEQLVYEGFENVHDDVVFDATVGDNSLQLIWIGTEELDFTEETEVAHVKFIYNSNQELTIDFAPAPQTSILSNAGALNPWETVSGVVTPLELDLKLTIEDVYQYSGASVDVPLVMSGVEEEINAGSITLRIAFDASLMDFSSMTSDWDFDSPGVSQGLLTLTLTDLEGVVLENGTIATLTFNFKDVGTSPLNFQFGTNGTNFSVLSGAVIPMTYEDGSVEVSVTGGVYDELLNLRDNTTLVLTNPAFNVVEAETTYPTQIKTSDDLGYPVITDVWTVDGLMSSSHAVPAGSVITLTHVGGAEFVFEVEEELAAGEFVFLSEMILQGSPDADVRTTLLSHKGLEETWSFDIRSPMTYETTLTVAVLTSHDDFVVSENGIHPGFVLAVEEILLNVYGDPQLVFAFNGEDASTGSTFEFCFDEEVIVTLSAILEGGQPFDITYTVNDEEFVAEGVELGDVIFEEILEPGTYEVVVTSIVDAYDRNVLNPEDIYYATVVVYPEPEVSLEDFGLFCEDVEPFELTGGLPEGGVYSGEGVADGMFSPAVAGPGSFIITYTYTSEEGCTSSAEATIAVAALPVVTCPGDTVVMLSHDPFELTGATPEGGVYSGPGVEDGMFDASVATDGEHTITYSYTNPDTGCTAECSFVITVQIDTSVPGEPVASDITLYPNPARSVLTIESDLTIDEIRMVDMLGQVVYSASVQWNRYELNVSEFRNGIYFVQILTGNGFTTHRVQVTN